MLSKSVQATARGSHAQVVCQAMPKHSRFAVGPKLAVWLAGTMATGALVLTTPCSPAQAADLALGEEVFSNNCAACHTGGNNVIQAEKTLRKAALEQYLAGGFNVEAITHQVENGKNAMPAWSGRLSADEIQAVAAYVYDQSSKDTW